MDLYALPPEEFVSAREVEAAQARRAGDRGRAAEIAALRRPTVSAYAVNALVRAQPELLEQLLDLGAQLAQAQSAGSGDDLRALGEQRRGLVEAVADQAEAAAGRDLSAAARTEVVETLEAAMADPASGDAVRTGRLVRPLSYAGFGGVDLEGAVAAGVAPVPATSGGSALQGEAGADGASDAGGRTSGRRASRERAASERAAQEREARERAQRDRSLAAAQERALAAAGVLDDAVRTAQHAEAAREAAEQESAAARDAVAEAERLLVVARERRDEAQRSERAAARAVERAHEQVVRAQREAERARTTLDRLRRGSTSALTPSPQPTG